MAPKATPSRRNHIAERNALTNAIHRCHNPDSVNFKNYGARGIAVCNAWRDKKTGFQAFFAHVGPRPSPLHSLDRIDNDKNYEPGNVRWTDKKTQQNNRRKVQATDCQDLGWGIGYTKPKKTGQGYSPKRSPLVPLGDRIQTLREWSEELGIKSATLRQRFAKGLTPEQALNPSTSKQGQIKRPAVGLYIDNPPSDPTIH